MRWLVAALAMVAALTVTGSSAATSQIHITGTLIHQEFSANGFANTREFTLKDRHGDRIGWGNLVCFNLVGRREQCFGTFVLPLGKVMVNGVRSSRDFSIMAVVGGTGRYFDAGGTFYSRTFAVSPTRQTLIFTLA